MKTLKDVIKDYRRIQQNPGKIISPCPELQIENEFTDLPNPSLKTYVKEMWDALPMNAVIAVNPQASTYVALYDGVNLGYLLGQAHAMEGVLGSVEKETVN